MPLPNTRNYVQIADRLAEIRSLTECAFMACAALNDPAHCDALQTTLAHVGTLVAEVETHFEAARDGLAADERPPS